MTIMGFRFGSILGRTDHSGVHVDRRSASHAGSTFLSFPENDFAPQCAVSQGQGTSRPNGHARMTSAYRKTMAPNF